MRPRLTLLVVTLAMVVLSAVPAAAAPDSQQQAERLLDRSREAAGRPALQHCDDLSDVARDWSRRMARDGRLRHNADVDRRIGDWSKWAENVVVASDVDEAHAALRASAAHRRSMLDAELDEVGIGVARGDGRVYVTQVFRRPDGGGGCEGE